MQFSKEIGENVLGELISAKLVGKSCQGMNSVMISGAMVTGIAGEHQLQAKRQIFMKFVLRSL